MLALPILCLCCNAQGTGSKEGVSYVHALPSGASRAHLQQPQAVKQQSVEYVIPELILGGEWTSTIRITNRGTTQMPSTNVYFVDNSGNDMTATFQTTTLLTNGTTVLGSPITGPGFSVFLQPGGIIEIVFSGGATAVFGQGIVDFCGTTANCYSYGIYGQVTLTNTNSTRPNFQSIFPFEQPASLQYMLFDDRNGISAVLYLVNENTSSMTASLQFLNAANQVIQTVSVPMVSLGSQILTLDTIAPAIIGLQGTLVINSGSSNLVLTATALQINPTNSFTPLRAFIPSP